MGEVKLIPVYYTGIVTGWGCTFCLHTVVGEGRRLKDFLNPLPGPKSRSAVSCMSILSSLTFYFAYIFIHVMSFSFNFLFHDLSVNFVIPLYVCI